jgi:hypothetical protein
MIKKSCICGGRQLRFYGISLVVITPKNGPEKLLPSRINPPGPKNLGKGRVWAFSLSLGYQTNSLRILVVKVQTWGFILFSEKSLNVKNEWHWYLCLEAIWNWTEQRWKKNFLWLSEPSFGFLKLTSSQSFVLKAKFGKTQLSSFRLSMALDYKVFQKLSA